MWGRIAHIAEKLDGSFGNDDSRDNDDNDNDHNNNYSNDNFDAKGVEAGGPSSTGATGVIGGTGGCDNMDSVDNIDNMDNEDEGFDFDDGDGWDDADEFLEEDELDFGDNDGGANNDGADNDITGATNDDGIANGATDGGANNADSKGLLTNDIPGDAGQAHEPQQTLGPSAEEDDIVEMLDTLKSTPTIATEEVSSATVNAAPQCQISTEESNQLQEQIHLTNGTNTAKNGHELPELQNIITVAAPGKALVAGGYLVLEPNNPGVVLAAKGCRFHCTVMFRPPYGPLGPFREIYAGADQAKQTGEWKSIPIDVYSPQFDEVFCYRLCYSIDGTPATSNNSSDAMDADAIRLQPRNNQSHTSNKFVEKTLLLALGYVWKVLGGKEFHARIQQLEALGTQQIKDDQLSEQEQPLAQQGQKAQQALAIKLRADNDFYSQIPHLQQHGLEFTPENISKLEPFLSCPKDESTGKVVVNKTGLGSSAALVTSLVGGLLRFFGVVVLPHEEKRDKEMAKSANIAENMNGSKEQLREETSNGDAGIKEGLRISHNLSQVCHCYAQGKVGSGFDVSSAVYGSQIYTRFSKNVFDSFLEELEAASSASKSEQKKTQQCLSLSKSLSHQLLQIINDPAKKWDCTTAPIQLPPGLELLMADVCGGSESPSMAKQILAWKKNNRRVGFMDDYYWKDLKRCNKKIASLLSNQFASQPILDGLRRDGAMIIANRNAEQWKKPMPSSWHEFEGSSWDVASKLLDLRMVFLESRQNLKGMGKAAGVPVEPEEQTKLADATMKLPGVVAAGVPGAGGYDALFCIYVKGPETGDGRSDRVRDEIAGLWRGWSKGGSDNGGEKKSVVCPLSLRAAGSLGDSGLCAMELDW